MKWSGILKTSPSLHTTRILVFYSGCPIKPNLLRLLKEKVSGFNFLLRSEILTFLSFIWTDWLWPFWYNRYRECIKKLKLCKLSESKQRALARLMFGIWHILPSKLLYLFIFFFLYFFLLIYDEWLITWPQTSLFILRIHEDFIMIKLII